MKIIKIILIYANLLINIFNMEDRITKLDKEIKELISENSSLRQDIKFLKNKISTLEKKI